MNKHLRKTLDWVELPITLFFFLIIKNETRKMLKIKMDNWTCDWRKKKCIICDSTVVS